MKQFLPKRMISALGFCAVLFAGSVSALWAEVPESLKAPILPENLLTLTGNADSGKVSRSNMVFQWLLPQVIEAEKAWRAKYETIKTPEQISEYQKNLRAKFLEAIGPLPQRTPLNAKITGRIQQDGYVMEKILFESQPGLYVTGILYLPDEKKYPKPWNGVVVACGHSQNGKGRDIYQRVASLHAYYGIAALLVDPIDQGERFQNFDKKTKKPRAVSVQAHNQLGIGCILLGSNTAAYEIWDLMRALDYLQTREEIRPDRLGMAGLSGGGTQTSYLMALEDRVSVAATCCYTCSLYGLMKANDTQDAEQNIFGQAAFGMDHADYCMMRAPKPTLFGTATRDFFPIEMGWQSFHDSKRFYSRMGYGENVDLIETDNSHTYDQILREATVRFMLRFLDKRETPIFEPETLKTVTDKEILVTPEGFTLLLDGARSTYDLNRDRAKELAAARKPIDAEIIGKIRDLAKVRDAAEFGEMKCREMGEEKLADGISAKKLILEPEAGIYLPAILFKPQNAQKSDVVLYVADKGKTAGFDEAILPLVKAGKTVLSVELRGYGETMQSHGASYYRPDHLGTDGHDFYVAYNLAKTHVGFRTDDIFAVTRWLKKQDFCAGVELYALSEACVPALHAAVLDKDAFKHVTLEKCLVSWTNTIENGEFSRTPLTSTVHGALCVYDLPEMRAYLEKNGKLTVKSLKDALEK